MSHCTADFSAWCASHRLQLNADKTEVVGSEHNLAKLQQYDLTLTVGTETVQPVNIVRNLGVWTVDRPRTVYEAARRRSCRRLFSPAETLTANSTTCWS